MSKVPNRGNRDRYHVDSTGVAFSAKSILRAFKNLRKINGPILKTAPSAINARPSLIELTTVRGNLGLPIERDMHFDADKPLAAYADEARGRGYITT